jgi:hypothetical protein
MQQKLGRQIFKIIVCLKIGADCCVLIYPHHPEGADGIRGRNGS